MGESSPVNVRLSFTNRTWTPRLVRSKTIFRRSSRLRASRSIEWHTSVSPSRMKDSSSSRLGRFVSLPEVLSVNVLSSFKPSSCRSSL
jgi:hypothetical protein